MERDRIGRFGKIIEKEMDTKMCNEDIKIHKERHIELHRSFDELVADYIHHTKNLLRETTVMDLIEWSYSQTENPKE